MQHQSLSLKYNERLFHQSLRDRRTFALVKMAGNCGKCDTVINDDARITCRGYCGKSFHMICVQMEHSVREFLNAYARNMFWLCDGCSAMFTNEHFRKMTSRCNNDCVPDETSMKSLKDDIAGLKQIVSTLSSKVDSKPLTPLLNRSWRKKDAVATIPNTPKRNRSEMDQPLTKPPAIRGTKARSEIIKTVPPPEDLFWIYLSAFEPCTSDSEITAFVKECMQMPVDSVPKVVRLVPKDRDPATLSFVTFKVGVKKDLKDVALSSDTWPENIAFREFDNYSKNRRRVVSIAAQRSPDAAI